MCYLNDKVKPYDLNNGVQKNIDNIVTYVNIKVKYILYINKKTLIFIKVFCKIKFLVLAITYPEPKQSLVRDFALRKRAEKQTTLLFRVGDGRVETGSRNFSTEKYL